MLDMNVQLRAVLELHGDKRLMFTHLFVRGNMDLAPQRDDSRIPDNLVGKLHRRRLAKQQGNSSSMINTELRVKPRLRLGVIRQKQDPRVRTRSHILDGRKIKPLLDSLLVGLDPSINGSVDDPVAGKRFERVAGNLPRLAEGVKHRGEVLASAHDVRPTALSLQALQRPAVPVLHE